MTATTEDRMWDLARAALREEFDAQMTIYAMGSTPERQERLERATQAIKELAQHPDRRRLMAIIPHEVVESIMNVGEHG